jgi:hypothetical protein
LYKKGGNVSKTKGKEEKEPPNYKFLGGETEEIGSPNVVFMRPQLVKIYNEKKKSSMFKNRGQRKLFRKEQRSLSLNPNT